MEFSSPHIQTIYLANNTPVDVLRIDAIDEIVSGNKWFKLKKNLEQARKIKAKGILTFGGQHSNHLAATAEMCRREGLSSVAVIRGEKPTDLSPTLTFVLQCGMELVFVSRSDYQNKELLLGRLQNKYPEFWFVPEGGANEQGRLGSEEIAHFIQSYNMVFCACGTGTMYTGIQRAMPSNTIVGGINVLKGSNQMVDEVNRNLPDDKKIVGNEVFQQEKITQSFISDHFSFGGYAAFQPELYKFTQLVSNRFDLRLDHVYTAKLFYAVNVLLLEKRLEEGQSLILIHSGGLQGNAAFEQRYADLIAKNMP